MTERGPTFEITQADRNMALPGDLNMTDEQLIRLCRRQDAENEKLREALKPFAAIPLWRDQYPDAKRDELGAQQMRGFVRVEDVRAARAALAAMKSGDDNGPQDVP